MSATAWRPVSKNLSSALPHTMLILRGWVFVRVCVGVCVCMCVCGVLLLLNNSRNTFTYTLLKR